MSDRLTYQEAVVHAEYPKTAIAMGLVLLDRVATALETIARKP